jgi:hypothetical protein
MFIIAGSARAGGMSYNLEGFGVFLHWEQNAPRFMMQQFPFIAERRLEMVFDC